MNPVDDATAAYSHQQPGELTTVTGDATSERPSRDSELVHSDVEASSVEPLSESGDSGQETDRSDGLLRTKVYLPFHISAEVMDLERFKNRHGADDGYHVAEALSISGDDVEAVESLTDARYGKDRRNP